MRLEALRKLWSRLRAGEDPDRNFSSDSFTDSELAVGRMILPLLDDLAAAEKALERSSGHARALEVVLRLLPVGAIVIDGRGRLLSANESARQLFQGPALPERVVAAALQATHAGSDGVTLLKADGGGLALRLVPADVAEPVDANGTSVVFLIPRDRQSIIDSAALSRRFGLTPAQMKVCDLLCCGLTNREIADDLGISVETVRKHVGAIFEKTGVNKRSALVGLAYGVRFGQSQPLADDATAY